MVPLQKDQIDWLSKEAKNRMESSWGDVPSASDVNLHFYSSKFGTMGVTATSPGKAPLNILYGESVCE